MRAIRHNEFYVFTHMHTKDWLLARHQRIIAAFDECEKWIQERQRHPPSQQAGIHNHEILGAHAVHHLDDSGLATCVRASRWSPVDRLCLT